MLWHFMQGCNVVICDIMWLYVALVACWRLWGLCGARMFDCVASIGAIARGAAAAVTSQHDHFDQDQIACIAGHIHG